MNIVFTPTDGITSRFIQEEYIPLTVSFNDKDYVKHIGFYYGDTDLCEFGIDPETNEIPIDDIHVKAEYTGDGIKITYRNITETWEFEKRH